jgi:hypothetical protein
MNWDDCRGSGGRPDANAWPDSFRGEVLAEARPVWDQQRVASYLARILDAIDRIGRYTESME